MLVPRPMGLGFREIVPSATTHSTSSSPITPIRPSQTSIHRKTPRVMWNSRWNIASWSWRRRLVGCGTEAVDLLHVNVHGEQILPALVWESRHFRAPHAELSLERRVIRQAECDLRLRPSVAPSSWRGVWHLVHVCAEIAMMMTPRRPRWLAGDWDAARPRRRDRRSILHGNLHRVGLPGSHWILRHGGRRLPLHRESVRGGWVAHVARLVQLRLRLRGGVGGGVRWRRTCCCIASCSRWWWWCDDGSRRALGEIPVVAIAKLIHRIVLCAASSYFSRCPCLATQTLAQKCTIEVYPSESLGSLPSYRCRSHAAAPPVPWYASKEAKCNMHILSTDTTIDRQEKQPNPVFSTLRSKTHHWSDPCHSFLRTVALPNHQH